ncbi:hypothetical protein F53441_11272 [Fusarium austroafricanum]|uniref:Uncharacterized protein n=1 Tax=Fusarium austroafricanum TaxID=2364996 RepID=A0A8H4K3F2_9HYPO|nr:hypothetical protein F53441_11272 [Fusarium austroafricanum]
MSSSEEQSQGYTDTHFPPPAERSAEMPMLWNEEHRSLIDSCTRNESLYPLLIQLPKLADDLEGNQTLKDNNFPVDFTVSALHNCDWTMCALLHSMPFNVVKSIVKNTFAYHDYNGSIQCFKMPTDTTVEVPGVYVVGLMRLNKRGQFLNIKEMELLISDMKDYVQGYRAYVKFAADVAANGRATAKSNQSAEENKATRFVASVDSHAGGSYTEKPAFIEKEDEIPRIEALIATYERMCDRSLGPTRSIRMMQSPLNVLRILKADQLALAEQLVTTLAGSLIYQHGFNSTEAGGTGSNTIVSEDGLKLNVELVISRLRIMIHNLGNSVDEVNLRQRFLKDIELVQAQVQEINEAIKESVETLQSLPDGFQWNETLSEVEESVQVLKKNLQDKEEALKFWNPMIQIQGIIIKEIGHGIDLL